MALPTNSGYSCLYFLLHVHKTGIYRIRHFGHWKSLGSRRYHKRKCLFLSTTFSPPLKHFYLNSFRSKPYSGSCGEFKVVPRDKLVRKEKSLLGSKRRRNRKGRRMPWTFGRLVRFVSIRTPFIYFPCFFAKYRRLLFFVVPGARLSRTPSLLGPLTHLCDLEAG